MADVECEFLGLTSLYLRNYVDKMVKIVLCDNSTIQGWVYTIDPVTKTIVIAETSESKDTQTVNATCVMGHAIRSIDIEQDFLQQHKPDLGDIFRDRRTSSYSKQDLLKRKVELRDWLGKNRIPWTEDGDEEVLCVMGVLCVDPPYEPDSCRCANEIILDRIQNLIRNMPSTDT